MKHRRLNLREPKVGLAVAGAILVVALIVVVSTAGSSAPDHRRVSKQWFYDLNTKKLYEADLKALPPMDAPSGQPGPEGEPAGVLAIVYGCGDCSDPFIGYLQKYRPEGRKLAEAGQFRAAAEFIVLRAPDGVPEGAPKGDAAWVPKNSAGAIIGSALTRCPKGKKLVTCND